MDNIQYQRHHNLTKTHWWYISTNRFFFDLIGQYIPSDEPLLDAGCGTGGLIDLLKRSYSSVVGIDSSETALDFCRLAGMPNVLEGSVESLPFNDNLFAGVISLDVLYHRDVKDEVLAMKEMVRVLRPGGYVFLQLPAYEWMRSRHDEIAHTSRRYTSSRVRDLLNECNLTINRISYRVCIIFPLAVIKRKLLNSGDSDMRPVNPLTNLLLKSVMLSENFLLRHTNLPFGLSVFAVAQKKSR